jgi:hypothetical protein
MTRELRSVLDYENRVYRSAYSRTLAAVIGIVALAWFLIDKLP